MRKKKLNSLSTLELAPSFVKATREFDRIENANLLNDPIRYFSRKIGGAHKANKQLNDISIVLLMRYESILLQMLRQAGESDDKLKKLITTIWLDVSNNSRTEMDYRCFSKFIWNAYTAAVINPDLRLKPKLMLRQFVDDIQSCREQGVLLSLAYGDRNYQGFSQPNRETRHSLNTAYCLLHERLEKHKCHLSILTDNVISKATFKSKDTMLEKYERWLFE